MKNIYIKNEAKKNFKGWSKQGLEFLLQFINLDKKTRLQVSLKLREIISAKLAVNS
ncbi:hypothetical protein [Aliarcobacter cryaerophilus]|uniref:hypothetical protein n=1 Tax=Aliarcobacter cryaerophilus TaxID=28198 RepID=UPI0021B167E5|nr:hypothetical protein [Aliarcobacter cryaerophilus]MCT7508620.1 hypothetical protein [Aliarcobacter cryaerophilus]